MDQNSEGKPLVRIKLLLVRFVVEFEHHRQSLLVNTGESLFSVLSGVLFKCGIEFFNLSVVNVFQKLHVNIFVVLLLLLSEYLKNFIHLFSASTLF